MKLLISSIMLLGLVGCATAPPTDFTITEITKADNPVSGVLSGVSVENRVGGKSYLQDGDSTFFIWKEALSSALYQSESFTGEEGRKFKVEVLVLQLKSPSFGATMKTQSTAEYTVLNAETNDVIWSTIIEAEGVVPSNYAFVGYVRAKESINRSVQSNISEFIAQLHSVEFHKQK